MKNNKTTFRLDLLTSTDELRPAMMGVMVENKYAISTNGHYMAVIDWKEAGIDLEPAIGRLIPAPIWKIFSTSFHAVLFTDERRGVAVRYTAKKGGIEQTAYGEILETFPNWRGVVNAEYTVECQGFDTIAINFGLFGVVSDALGLGSGFMSSIKLTGKYGGPIVFDISAWGYNERKNVGFGLIMPIVWKPNTSTNGVEYKDRVLEVTKYKPVDMAEVA
jgi:hypothetical protein